MESYPYTNPGVKPYCINDTQAANDRDGVNDTRSEWWKLKSNKSLCKSIISSILMTLYGFNFQHVSLTLVSDSWWSQVQLSENVTYFIKTPLKQL